MIFDLPNLPKTVRAAKLPSWTIEKSVHRCCPVCASDSPRPIVRRPDKFIVHLCSTCGMIYLADIPCNEEISNFYKEYASFKEFQKTNRDCSWVKREWFAKRNRFISILEATGGIKGLNVCEIGCSYGEFLKLIKHRGGKVFGVEIDNDAQCFLKECGIYITSVIDTSVEYDIVCLIQVLEHLISPSEMLSDISKSLKKDGRALISVPNGGEYAKAGPSWIGFRVDFEHLNYFDLLSLTKLLFKHELIVEQFWEHTQPAIKREINTKNYITNPFKKGWMRIRNIISGLLCENISQKGSFVLTVVARKL